MVEIKNGRLHVGGCMVLTDEEREQEERNFAKDYNSKEVTNIVEVTIKRNKFDKNTKIGIDNTKCIYPLGTKFSDKVKVGEKYNLHLNKVDNIIMIKKIK